MIHPILRNYPTVNDLYFLNHVFLFFDDEILRLIIPLVQLK